MLSYTSDVPPSLLKECLLTGTPAEVIDQAAEWRDHGLRYAVMGNASGMQPSLRRGLAASVPFAKDSSWTSQAINEATRPLQMDRFRDWQRDDFLAVESGHLVLAGPVKSGAYVVYFATR